MADPGRIYRAIRIAIRHQPSRFVAQIANIGKTGVMQELAMVPLIESLILHSTIRDDAKPLLGIAKQSIMGKEVKFCRWLRSLQRKL